MHFSRSCELSEMCARMCNGARAPCQDTAGHRDKDKERCGDNQVLSSRGECGVAAVARQFLIEFTLRVRRHCDSGRGGMQHERYECGQNDDECHSPAHSKTTGNYRLQLLITHTPDIHKHTHTHKHSDTRTPTRSLVSELSWKWLALRFLRLRGVYSTQRDLTWLNHDIAEDNDNMLPMMLTICCQAGRQAAAFRKDF